MLKVCVCVKPKHLSVALQQICYDIEYNMRVKRETLFYSQDEITPLVVLMEAEYETSGQCNIRMTYLLFDINI